VAAHGAGDEALAGVEGLGAGVVLVDGEREAVGADDLHLVHQPRADAAASEGGGDDDVGQVRVGGEEGGVAGVTAVSDGDPVDGVAEDSVQPGIDPLVEGVGVNLARALLVPSAVPKGGGVDEVAGVVGANDEGCCGHCEVNHCRIGEGVRFA
jgi:hypothetical protein